MVLPKRRASLRACTSNAIRLPSSPLPPLISSMLLYKLNAVYETMNWRSSEDGGAALGLNVNTFKIDGFIFRDSSRASLSIYLFTTIVNGWYSQRCYRYTFLQDKRVCSLFRLFFNVKKYVMKLRHKLPSIKYSFDKSGKFTLQILSSNGDVCIGVC